MYITAKLDYAMRVVVTLAQRENAMTVTSIAETEQMPLHFLKRILAELRRSGILVNSRNGGGGYRLARPAATITIAEVFSAVGPLFRFPVADHTQKRQHDSAVNLGQFWPELGAGLRIYLEQITVADVARCART